MKRRNKTMALLAMCMVCMCGCSNESEEDSVDNKLVELAVNPSIMQVRAERGVQTGTTGSALEKIAVYANSTTTNNTTNNYAVYTYSDTKWTAGADKIYLSGEGATIYASYPSTATAAHDAAVTGESVVEISTFAGATDADNDNTITITDANTINACTKEVDYMYATPVTDKNNKSATVALTMKHAMSMVSFRVYKDASYTNSGRLTKIVLSNATAASANVLLKPETDQKATMKLDDGAVTINGGGEAATYTRFTKSSSNDYYTLQEAAKPDAAATTVPAFSILVYPIATAIEAGKVQAAFTIDDKEYTITLPARTKAEDGYAWAPGQNYVYSVTMNGKELSVTSVTLTDWVTTPIDGGTLVQ